MTKYLLLGEEIKAQRNDIAADQMELVLWGNSEYELELCMDANSLL